MPVLDGHVGLCPLCEGGFVKTLTAGRWECIGCGAILLVGRGSKYVQHWPDPGPAPSPPALAEGRKP